MVTSSEQVTASSACLQVIDDYGLGKAALPSIGVGELERVVADLVKKALSNPALWPSGPSPSPAFPFGLPTPPLEADELEKRLVKAADTGSQPDCANIGVAPDIPEIREIRCEEVMGVKQDSDSVTGPPNPESTGIDNDNDHQPPCHVQTDAGTIIPFSDDPTVSSAGGSETCKVESLVVEYETLQGGQSASGVFEACEIRFENVTGAKQDSPNPHPEALPDSSCTPPSELVTMDQLKELFKAVLEHKPQLASDGAMVGPTEPEQKIDNDQDKDNKRVRASKVEYKTVNEVWDSKEYGYKIVDSPPAQDISELDEYVFVIRKRIHKHTNGVITYVDVKSPSLRDLLRKILKDIKTAGLEADKPAIERNFLFHFLPELKNYSSNLDQVTTEEDGMRHLELLIQHLEEAYEDITKQINSLLRYNKITYDLLWAFFKPGTLVYVTCPSTGLPRCIRYNFGKESETIRKEECFDIYGQYFDYNGEIFGESTETLQVKIFHSARRIETLPAYPLEFHPDSAIWSRLVSAGRKFVSLIGCYHRQYEGNMFVPHKNQLMKVHVSSRIMIDAQQFRKVNPNYARFETKKLQTDIFGQIVDNETFDRVRNNGLGLSELKDEDFAICSPTVLGFSLNKKIWGEFAVEKVTEIHFSNAPFDMLSIPEDKKRVIKSLTESRVSATTEARFDDIIEGKGQGVIILLHGPPGVGKTLTAEAISERLQRPLYSISAGDLSARAEELKVQLTRTFRIASNWKAVLLLDEADVYLQKRDSLQLERNRLVATFLRTLEYFPGIFFLTTNMLQDFDAAILD